MKHSLKKATLFFILAILLNVTASADTAYGFERLEIAYQNGETVERIFLSIGESVDLRFLGAPSNWSLLHPTWNSFDEDIATVDMCGVVTAENVGWTVVCLRLDNDMIGTVFIYVSEPLPETIEEKAEETIDETSELVMTPEAEPEVKQPVEEEQTEKKIEVILNNQETIRIPSNAKFTDGTSVENMIDIARYAFSYATTTNELIIPTYEADKYGIAEIAAVDYSAIKGPRTVIVKNVYFKVYLDLDKNGTVTKEEKTSDIASFYTIKVVVDRTLIVEDWNIVK